MGYYEIPPIETFDAAKWAEEEIRKMNQAKTALAAMENSKRIADACKGLKMNYLVIDDPYKPKIHTWPENMLKPLPTSTYNFKIQDLLDLDALYKTWNNISNDIVEEGRKAMKKFNDNMSAAMGIKGTHQDPLNQKEVEEEYWEFDDLVKRIVFNPPATIVFWFDGTKTVVKCGKDQPFNPYYGFCAALAKRMLGHNCAINRHIDEYVVQMDRKAAQKYEESYSKFNNEKAIEKCVDACRKVQEDFRKELEKPKEPEKTEEVEYECYETTWEDDAALGRYCNRCVYQNYNSSDDPCKKCLHTDKSLKFSYYKSKYNEEDSKNG